MCVVGASADLVPARRAIIGLPQGHGMTCCRVRFAMKRSGLLALWAFSVCIPCALAADATSPVDYTQRNSPFAPSGSVAPEKQTPATNERVQEKKVEKNTIEKQTAPLAERRAAIEIKETREKNVREKDTRKPETVTPPTSAYNHRPAAISTGADTTKPPTVAKYQDRLTDASATNMARFPAIERATTAKINRFVFRKNPSEPSGIATGGAVTPAAGGSPLQK